MSAPEFQAIVAARGFSLGVRCTEDEVLAIEYLAPRPVQAPASPLAAETARQILAYLADPAFEFGLPLRPAGTFFQRRVWAEIARIPLGQTLSYGALAKRINNAPRAVGQACGRNPYPLVVPCHRVIAAGGGLGGFSQHSAGLLLDIKRWLLQHEGCQLAATPD